MPIPPSLRSLLAATALAGLLVACRPAPPEHARAPSDLSRPALAVQALSGHMRSGDFAAFARDAVPPSLHARLQLAWASGDTRWPLDELPFSDRLPEVLTALAAPDAEAGLAQGFERQFAGSSREIRAAAATLGMFGVQYMESQGDFSEGEREHYAQLVAALAHWAAQAPLADAGRAQVAIGRLSAAARAAGPTTAEGMAAAGMDATLAHVGGFSNEAKAVLVDYGLDLDAAFDSVSANLQVQQGDRATVRLRYELAGRPIDTLLALERIDSRWYLADYLRHAREAVTGVEEAAAAPPAPAAEAVPPQGPVAAP